MKRVVERETERHHLERERALLEAKGKLRSTGLAHNEHGTWTVMRKQRREVGGGEGSPLPSPTPPIFQPPVFAAAFASTGRDGELEGQHPKGKLGHSQEEVARVRHDIVLPGNRHNSQ